MGQSASFTPRTITLGAMRMGVKQSNSGRNSQCDRQVRMPPSLTIGHDRPRAWREWLIWSVWFVSSISFVWFVWFVSFARSVNQINQMNQTNQSRWPTLSASC
jgi:hypothetical protein